MADYYALIEGQRTRNPDYVLRAVRPDGSAVHIVRNARKPAEDALIFEDRDEAIRELLRRIGYEDRVAAVLESGD